MGAAIHFGRQGDIAIAILDHPPVNALNQAMRHGLLDAVRTFTADPSLGALILAGRGRLFSAGSDINEFSRARLAPALADVMGAIEACAKPVAAALHDRTLGGGFELALACHARVMHPDARVGLPEIHLGLLPGAGGTQRLPRLIGAAPALSMIATGREVGAQEAVALGLADAIVDGDLVAGAMDFVRQALASGRSFALAAHRDDHLRAAREAPEMFEAEASAIARRHPGQSAPAACIEAVRAAIERPLAEGLARERELFQALESAEESRALRHLFFAERAAVRLPACVEALDTAAVRRATVVGAGLMGSGIAMCLTNAGIDVRLIDRDPASLDRAQATLHRQYQRLVDTGRLDVAQMQARMDRVSYATDLAVAADADVVVEAAPEILELKQQLFAQLGAIVGPETILASNTSTLDIDRIAQASGRPTQVLGLHFFSPAHVMRLVEIVHGAQTRDAIWARAARLVRALGKTGVTVGVCDGFVANRMMGQRSRHVDRLLLEGATPRQIDRATTEFGFPMGPLAVGDLAGLDVAQKVRQSRGQQFPVADALCALGRYGQKTRAGYYRYAPGQREPQDDPLVLEVVDRAAQAHGVRARTFSAQEILDRTLLPVINEGVRLLQEGIAAHASDIDVILAHGYGWPKWRGGPMFYADQRGLAKVCERLDALADQLQDERLRPAPLLRELADSGGSLCSRPRPDDAARRTTPQDRKTA
jgi:3-hydroxyacyl-CoA dehydrogenase